MKKTARRTELLKRLSDNARKLRAEHGLTQFDLANRMNLAKSGVSIHPGRISQIESGKWMPSLETLCALALALDTTLDTLTGFESIFEGCIPE